MSDELSRGGFESNDLATRAYVDTAVAGASGGGSGSVYGSIAVGSIAFNRELYLGPGIGGGYPYSYTSGGAGYFFGAWALDTTVVKIGFLTSSLGVDLTLRLRDSGGSLLWTGTLTAGQTSVSVSPSVVIPAGTQVQFSVAPASGTPTLGGASVLVVGVL